jgi:thiamine-phosphate pyrophosphorylase
MRGLYVIIDPEHCVLAPLAVAEAALRGGAAALQLRAKRLSDAEVLVLAEPLLRLCRASRVPFFVNDRVALAVQLGADGVHVGQDDQPIEAVRALAGARLRVGVSTHSLVQALDAELRGADLIGFGPVFTTASKANPDPVVGLAGLAEACARVAIPVVAIGGVSEANAAEVASAGAAFAAVISAVCRAGDPERAARRLCERLAGA